MKNLALISVILLTGCLLSSCLKDSLSKPKDNGSSNTTGTHPKDTTNTTTTTTTTSPPIVIDPSLLIGTWQVINDTTTNTPWGLWGGRPATGTNYIGTPADYYKFTADGHLYDFIQGHADTATYTISKNQVDIEYSYTYNAQQPAGLYHGLFTFTDLGPHGSSFSTEAVSPEVAFDSVTNLRR